MHGQLPLISDYEEVVVECDGCGKSIKSFRGKFICGRHFFPRIQWSTGEKCPDATHIEIEELEDPIKEP